MIKFTLLLSIYLYYVIWLLLPIFDLDGSLWLFPLPSKYAALLPIVLLLVGTLIVGTFLGVLLLKAQKGPRMMSNT
ncbi:uncharacterized protein Ecym_8237 [Eremothecium cymbalariae DBVPG|uniref:Dolichol phosphate-mannose biosynthesis regulatory protein n=1 Tax=Eremothecium cymbalariae (strain CBS 270.75 / DBVPG 7215 / KCTC 17166 / NRRL Y-17582) TaxID=931890 RepID=G8JXE8_ERECY|nr:Hypothetical protein Ecym_8237 [Eremothecium cymbalariae DBVPG\